MMYRWACTKGKAKATIQEVCGLVSEAEITLPPKGVHQQYICVKLNAADQKDAGEEALKQHIKEDDEPLSYICALQEEEKKKGEAVKAELSEGSGSDSESKAPDKGAAATHTQARRGGPEAAAAKEKTVRTNKGCDSKRVSTKSQWRMVKYQVYVLIRLFLKSWWVIQQFVGTGHHWNGGT